MMRPEVNLGGMVRGSNEKEFCFGGDEHEVVFSEPVLVVHQDGVE